MLTGSTDHPAKVLVVWPQLKMNMSSNVLHLQTVPNSKVHEWSMILRVHDMLSLIANHQRERERAIFSTAAWRKGTLLGQIATYFLPSISREEAKTTRNVSLISVSRVLKRKVHTPVQTRSAWEMGRKLSFASSAPCSWRLTILSSPRGWNQRHSGRCATGNWVKLFRHHLNPCFQHVFLCHFHELHL